MILQEPPPSTNINNIIEILAWNKTEITHQTLPFFAPFPPPPLKGWRGTYAIPLYHDLRKVSANSWVSCFFRWWQGIRNGRKGFITKHFRYLKWKYIQWYILLYMDPMSYTDWFIRILLMKKTQANQLIWKFIPFVTRFFDIPGGAGFLPSRVLDT